MHKRAPNLAIALLLALACDASYSYDEPRKGGDTIEASDHMVGAMYHHWYEPNRWATHEFPYTPELGEYDSAEPAVVRQHVAWAREAGINTFVVDTWIPPRDQWWMNRNTPPVVDVLDAEGMNYFFFADGWFQFPGSDAGGYDAQAIAAHVNANLSHYFQRPGYVRVGGRPVIFFWGTDNTSCDLWRKVRAGIEGTIGPVYMTGFNGAGDRSCWDRLLYYNPYNPAYTTASAQLSWQSTLWQSWSSFGQPWAPTASPGYNDTLVRAGNPPIPLDPNALRTSVRTSLSFPQHHPQKWLFVCSFNEWHEASVIEPTTEFADSHVFLRVLREELSAAGWLSNDTPPGPPATEPPPASGSPVCDPVTEPAPHYADNNGACLPSCGLVGGQACVNAYGTCPVGTAPGPASYDCDTCCI